MAYANTAAALSNILEALEIQCPDINFDDDHGPPFLSASPNKELALQHDVLVDNLKSFARLQILWIKEINDVGRNITHYDYIINQCLPSVTDLEFQSECQTNYFARALETANVLS